MMKNQKGFIIILIIILLSANSVSGTVTDFMFYPDNMINVGESITVVGSVTDVSEVIYPTITFSTDVTPDSYGKYNYNIEDIMLPADNDKISVTAENVKDLTVGAYIWVFFGKSWTQIANEGKVTMIKGPVPITAFSWDIFISGIAKDSSEQVHLTIKASSKKTVDSTKQFTYTFNTQGLRPGEYNVKIGEIEKLVTLK